MSAEGSVCPKCGEGILESRAKTSSLVCNHCGDVAEESAAVTALEWAEGAGGTSGVTGTYIIGNAPRGVGGEGGEAAMSNALNRLKTILSRIPQSRGVQSHHVDKAHRSYRLAFKSRKTHGRKLDHVLAVLLYLATRQDESAQSALLVDFAEAVGADVFTLGSLMLRLKSELSLRVTTLDPCLLIDHYSAKMELGERRAQVATTANKIVARMKRDWIAEGRRPAGICGAALLLAARIHGFQRTRAQMQHVVRVTETTIRSRMAEFGNTASSLMTPEEFDKLGYTDEALPPAFVRGVLEDALASAQWELQAEAGDGEGGGGASAGDAAAGAGGAGSVSSLTTLPRGAAWLDGSHTATLPSAARLPFVSPEMGVPAYRMASATALLARVLEGDAQVLALVDQQRLVAETDIGDALTQLADETVRTTQHRLMNPTTDSRLARVEEADAIGPGVFGNAFAEDDLGDDDEGDADDVGAGSRAAPAFVRRGRVASGRGVDDDDDDGGGGSRRGGRWQPPSDDVGDGSSENGDRGTSSGGGAMPRAASGEAPGGAEVGDGGTTALALTAPSASGVSESAMSEPVKLRGRRGDVVSSPAELQSALGETDLGPITTDTMRLWKLVALLDRDWGRGRQAFMKKKSVRERLVAQLVTAARRRERAEKSTRRGKSGVDSDDDEYASPTTGGGAAAARPVTRGAGPGKVLPDFAAARPRRSRGRTDVGSVADDDDDDDDVAGEAADDDGSSYDAAASGAGRAPRRQSSRLRQRAAARRTTSLLSQMAGDLSAERVGEGGEAEERRASDLLYRLADELDGQGSGDGADPRVIRGLDAMLHGHGDGDGESEAGGVTASSSYAGDAEAATPVATGRRQAKRDGGGGIAHLLAAAILDTPAGADGHDSDSGAEGGGGGDGGASADAPGAAPSSRGTDAARPVSAASVDGSLHRVHVTGGADEGVYRGSARTRGRRVQIPPTSEDGEPMSEALVPYDADGGGSIAGRSQADVRSMLSDRLGKREQQRQEMELMYASIAQQLVQASQASYHLDGDGSDSGSGSGTASKVAATAAADTVTPAAAAAASAGLAFPSASPAVAVVPRHDDHPVMMTPRALLTSHVKRPLQLGTTIPPPSLGPTPQPDAIVESANRDFVWQPKHRDAPAPTPHGGRGHAVGANAGGRRARGDASAVDSAAAGSETAGRRSRRGSIAGESDRGSRISSRSHSRSLSRGRLASAATSALSIASGTAYSAGTGAAGAEAAAAPETGYDSLSSCSEDDMADWLVPEDEAAQRLELWRVANADFLKRREAQDRAKREAAATAPAAKASRAAGAGAAGALPAGTEGGGGRRAGGGGTGSVRGDAGSVAGASRTSHVASLAGFKRGRSVASSTAGGTVEEDYGSMAVVAAGSGTVRGRSGGIVGGSAYDYGGDEDAGGDNDDADFASVNRRRGFGGGGDGGDEGEGDGDEDIGDGAGRVVRGRRVERGREPPAKRRRKGLQSHPEIGDDDGDGGGDGGDGGDD